MLDFLSKELNFTYSLKPPTDGTWNGILKDLKDDIIDFGKNHITIQKDLIL